jgi:F-type H+-transporting ATPase subunit delta
MNEIALRIGEIYAQALFDLAREAGLTDAVWGDLAAISEIVRTEPDFAVLSSSPYFSKDFKSQLIRKMLAGRVTDLTLDFLMVVIRRGRLGFLSEIVNAYEKLWDIYHGRVDVEAVVAVPVDEGLVKKLKAEIEGSLESSIKLKVVVNPDIWGGVIIRTGDNIIDNSARGKFERAVQNLISARK